MEETSKYSDKLGDDCFFIIISLLSDGPGL